MRAAGCSLACFDVSSRHRTGALLMAAPMIDKTSLAKRRLSVEITPEITNMTCTTSNA